MKTEKTNVMRLLEKNKVKYRPYSYVGTDAVSGTDVAREMGQDPNRVFKTLVTEGKKGEHYVFIVPVDRELDLKKAATAVGEKSIAMIKSKELLPLTGYIHGGCSPIGMKKTFTTVLDISAEKLESIIFSAGKIGYQVEVVPEELKKMVKFQFKDITVDK